MSGHLTELPWTFVATLIAPGSPVLLGDVLQTRDVASLQNGLNQAADLRVGRELFSRRCASCHGAEAHGGKAPSLRRPPLRRGNSDWAIYRGMTAGIAGTGMQAQFPASKDAWRIVAYIRSLQAGQAAVVSKSVVNVNVPFERILADSLNGWLSYSGAPDGRRFARGVVLSPSIAPTLTARWVRQWQGDGTAIQASPIVADGVIYVTTSPASVHAVLARTGEEIWNTSLTISPTLRVCCGVHNRGIAVLDSTVYVGTIDATIAALDARTGAERWRVPLSSPDSGYSITSAPLAVRDLIVVGLAGSEFGGRGLLLALDARTGRERWRRATVPAQADRTPDRATWGDARPAGGHPWAIGSYDPATNTIFWGTGNPYPGLDGRGRPGTNLHTNSLLALDAGTGALRWYYQFLAHDLHDWDGAQVPVLASLPVAGQSTPVVILAHKNGFAYVLDRARGTLISAWPMIDQSWSKFRDSTGKPIRLTESEPTSAGVVVAPGTEGATGPWAPALLPRDSALVVVVHYLPGLIYRGDAAAALARETNQGGVFQKLHSADSFDAVRSFDIRTGAMRWERRLPLEEVGGVSTTAGRTVLLADNGHVRALDGVSGADLWDFELGGKTAGPPVAFLLDGKPAVAVAAGTSLFVFRVP